MEWVSATQGQPRMDVSCAAGESARFGQCLPAVSSRNRVARVCASRCSGDPRHASTASGVGQNASGWPEETQTRPSSSCRAASDARARAANPGSGSAADRARIPHAVESARDSPPRTLDKPPSGIALCRSEASKEASIGLHDLFYFFCTFI